MHTFARIAGRPLIYSHFIYGGQFSHHASAEIYRASFACCFQETIQPIGLFKTRSEITGNEEPLLNEAALPPNSRADIWRRSSGVNKGNLQPSQKENVKWALGSALMSYSRFSATIRAAQPRGGRLASLRLRGGCAAVNVTCADAQLRQADASPPSHQSSVPTAARKRRLCPLPLSARNLTGH